MPQRIHVRLRSNGIVLCYAAAAGDAGHGSSADACDCLVMTSASKVAASGRSDAARTRGRSEPASGDGGVNSAFGRDDVHIWNRAVGDGEPNVAFSIQSCGARFQSVVDETSCGGDFWGA